MLPEGSEAWESLNHFAGFLRGSIDLLTAEGCIEAEREFETVMEYLYMEKERFGDDLTIVTDIRDREFMIPAFTLQTLVENAIQHGIRKNPDGRENADDGHRHIGMDNVRKRLELMCGGSLEVKSEPGKGSLVKVSIPEQWNGNG